MCAITMDERTKSQGEARGPSEARSSRGGLFRRDLEDQQPSFWRLALPIFMGAGRYAPATAVYREDPYEPASLHHTVSIRVKVSTNSHHPSLMLSIAAMTTTCI